MSAHDLIERMIAGLSGEQHQRVQALYDAMKAEAIAACEKLIDAETAA